jgi:hypothetical protein
LTAESLFYIPLRLVGVARFGGEVWEEAIVPGWADPTATAVQVLALAALAVVAVRVRRNVASGVALAAMAPVAFLLLNRVFSPQFLVPCFAAWAVAGALLATGGREELTLTALMFGASIANVLVYPVLAAHWGAFSALLFALALTATAWVIIRADADAARNRSSYPPVGVGDAAAPRGTASCGDRDVARRECFNRSEGFSTQ